MMSIHFLPCFNSLGYENVHTQTGQGSEAVSRQEHHPDSAGTMMAMMSGVKTNVGVLGVDKDIVCGDCSAVAGNEWITARRLAEVSGSEALGSTSLIAVCIVTITPTGGEPRGRAFGVWRTPSTVAHEYPSRKITQRWTRIKNENVLLVRHVDQYARRMGYQPSEINVDQFLGVMAYSTITGRSKMLVSLSSAVATGTSYENAMRAAKCRRVSL